MKKMMFYCQHILGMGHFVRSMEIVRGLIKDFEVCFINGGEVIPGFEVPPSVEVINLPAIKTDPEFQELQVVGAQSLEEVQESRKNQLLALLEQFKPDCLMIELFPFGRRRFSFELIPLLEQVQLAGRSTKVVCSLRDIIVTKQDQARHEAKICKLMNQYFDMLLIHGDPKFVGLEESFSRVKDLNCEVHYTGYVVQPLLKRSVTIDEDTLITNLEKPIILVSVGGGRFGHELLECVIETAPSLTELPYQIFIFTGPFMSNEKLLQLQEMASGKTNITLQGYTAQFLDYMTKADLSISMSGYNTTMNILTTGVRAMILPFTGNQDQEQRIRAEKLEKLGVVEVIDPNDLKPDCFAKKVISCLNKKPAITTFDMGGVEKTSIYLKNLLQKQDADPFEKFRLQIPEVFVGND